MDEPYTYGAKTEQGISFHIAVYETIQTIPYGHVTSYGHIAHLIGAPENSRQVGYALKNLPSANRDNGQPAPPPLNSETVPWWRVINSQGKISLIAERKQAQIARLRAENVEVDERSGKVSLSQFGWFPDDDGSDY